MPALVLGVCPAERPGDWHVHASWRDFARATWVRSAPSDVLVRFVLPRPLPVASGKQRRRGAPKANATQLEADIADEQLRHGDILQLDALSGPCAHAALLQSWFVTAVRHWPDALFYGRTEDDVYVQCTGLMYDLARVSARYLWLGLFAWTGNGEGEGCWGGAFDDGAAYPAKTNAQLLAKERRCPASAAPLRPSPTHEIDVRSAPLARAFATCKHPVRWLERQRGVRKDVRRGLDCANDYSAVQGLWCAHCVHAPVTLAHLTWTKVHSNAADRGWRPFAAPSNTTLVLDMNLRDRKIRTNVSGAWASAHAVMAPTASSSFPPLLYAYDPMRQAGDAPFVVPLNPGAAAMHHETCRWGGCHPSRGEAVPTWPGWQSSRLCGGPHPRAARRSTAPPLDRAATTDDYVNESATAAYPYCM